MIYRPQAQNGFYAMVAPSYEMAFHASAGTTLVSLFMSGALLPLPLMGGRLKPLLTRLSIFKYALSGIFFHFFDDCIPNVASTYGSGRRMLRILELDTIDSAWGNALACLGFYFFYTIGGFLGMKYTHKERR